MFKPQSAKPKRRTIHRDRYDGRLEAVLRVNGLDRFDRHSALDNDIVRRQREAAEFTAHVERQKVMAQVRAEVAARKAAA